MSLRTSVSRGVVGVLSVSIATAFLVAPSHHHLPSAPLRSSVGEGPLAGMFKKTLGAVAGLGKPTGSAELSGMVDGAPSWEALGEMLREQQTEEEREFRSNQASGRGEVGGASNATAAAAAAAAAAGSTTRSSSTHHPCTRPRSRSRWRRSGCSTRPTARSRA